MTSFNERYSHNDNHPWPNTEGEADTHFLESGHHDDQIIKFQDRNDPLNRLGPQERLERFKNFIRDGDYSIKEIHTYFHKEEPYLDRSGGPSHPHDEKELDINIPDTIDSIAPITVTSKKSFNERYLKLQRSTATTPPL